MDSSLSKSWGAFIAENKSFEVPIMDYDDTFQTVLLSMSVDSSAKIKALSNINMLSA